MWSPFVLFFCFGGQEKAVQKTPVVFMASFSGWHPPGLSHTSQKAVCSSVFDSSFFCTRSLDLDWERFLDHLDW